MSEFVSDIDGKQVAPAPPALPDDDELATAVLETMRLAYGDSNDAEIEAYRNALDIALGRLGVTVRGLTDAEIDAAMAGD